jgi:hypothetical protein
MAMSRCLGCKGTSFEAVSKEPRGSSYKTIFIQCASCGGVVGALDYMNTYVALQEQTKLLKKEIADIERSVGIVNDNLGRIAQRVAR